MTELRYRAYISYSHRDERWAAWLQRSLESYRVPRKLAGRTTAAGVVPSRIRPVFRDREDLSSAADLSATVREALAESENLIVLCSPAAAASRWVAEEIREFARLGRRERIFCLIVGGETDAEDSPDACFPPALAEIGLREPLAADARKWADGKRGARLKLIAGLLGVKLDELRQRDLRRRRVRQTVAGLAAAVVLTLAALAITAQVSERREREKAEQLATFIVDLGQHLQSDTDLATLATIGAQSYEYLRGLDPDRLSPKTGEKVALALRQMGRVAQGQGRTEQALEALRESRDLLERLVEQYPQENGLLFQLGNAEYYIGSLHREQAHHDKAMAAMRRYFELSHSLQAREPENPDWTMEMAYSHINLAAVPLDRGERIGETTLEHVSEANRLMEQALALRPDDQTIADNYATILAWSADTQLGVCNLERAGQLRDRTRELADSASRSDPANNDRKKRYAYALTGVARVQQLTGRLAQAVENLQHAIKILRQLSAEDPSNIVYPARIMEREVMLANLLGETGQLEQAGARMRELAPEIRSAFGTGDGNGISLGEYIDFLVAYADIESRLGDTESARRHLQTALRLQQDARNPGDPDLFELHRLAEARYLWWLLDGGDEAGDLPALPATAGAAGDYRSCGEADAMARIYLMRGQPDKAAEEVRYLQSKGYAEPGFIRFCRRHGLCPN